MVGSTVLHLLIVNEPKGSKGVMELEPAVVLQFKSTWKDHKSSVWLKSYIIVYIDLMLRKMHFTAKL